MPWMGFEPRVPASARAKTVHVLDRSATVTGRSELFIAIKSFLEWVGNVEQTSSLRALHDLAICAYNNCSKGRLQLPRDNGLLKQQIVRRKGK
jgi:hypothetical protein